ncbi:MAG: DUF3365 domain-containing protein [Cyanobacteriota bacterium]
MIVTRVATISRWVLLLLVCWILGTGLAAASTQPDPTQLAKVVESVEYLDQLRQGLASGLSGSTDPVTGETFKQVCRPVGMQAQTLAQENGWQVKQIAQKYRNPDHAPDNLHAKIALARFQQDADLIGFWDHELLDGQPGIRYYRRINVEASCLVCHGAKGSRPDFILNKYPQDLAYNFKVGDLRGMYAVFLPERVTISPESDP